MTMTPNSRPTINVVTPDISEKNDCAVDAMLLVNPAGSVMMFIVLLLMPYTTEQRYDPFYNKNRKQNTPAQINDGGQVA